MDAMDTETFDRFRSIVYKKSGIAIHANKIALVTARIGKRMRALSFECHRDYLHHLLDDESGKEMVQLLDCISTNVTSFFREIAHFDFFAARLAEWLKAGQSKFRFWSAASSTGKEPYSLAMTILNVVNDRTVDIKILATDLSTRVLARCVQGVYDAKRVESIPPAYRDRFFNRSGAAHRHGMRSGRNCGG